MPHPCVGIVVGAIGILAAAGFRPCVAEGSTTESGQPSIVVRTYTQAHAAGAIRTARQTVSAILGRAGIEVAWLECGLRTEATELSDDCTRPVRWNELVLRILPAGTEDRQRHLNTLGVALVDLDVGGGSLATVYADRVDLTAQSAGVDTAELLGRAMAHEIGHLLLGTNQHASRGLMRASWSSADLQRTRPTEWLFGDEEGDVMRRGIASRLRGRAAAHPK